MKYLWIIPIAVAWLYAIYDVVRSVISNLNNGNSFSIDSFDEVSSFSITWITINVIIFTILSFVWWIYDFVARYN